MVACKIYSQCKKAYHFVAVDDKIVKVTPQGKIIPLRPRQVYIKAVTNDNKIYM